MENLEKLVRFFIDLDCGEYTLDVEDYSENIRVVSVYSDGLLLEELKLAVSYAEPTAEEVIKNIRTTDEIIDDLPDYCDPRYTLEEVNELDGIENIDDSGGGFREE